MIGTQDLFGKGSVDFQRLLLQQSAIRARQEQAK